MLSYHRWILTINNKTKQKNISGMCIKILEKKRTTNLFNFVFIFVSSNYTLLWDKKKQRFIQLWFFTFFFFFIDLSVKLLKFDAMIGRSSKINLKKCKMSWRERDFNFVVYLFWHSCKLKLNFPFYINFRRQGIKLRKYSCLVYNLAVKWNFDS